MAALNFSALLKKSGCLSSAGPEILAFVGHWSANFRLILDCFISKFKLKYEDSENIKADHVHTVVFSLHQIKRQTLFFLGGTPGSIREKVIMTQV